MILSGKHVVLNIPTGGGKSFPQMAANIFAEGEKFFISTLKKKKIETKILSEEGKTAILILPLVALEPQFEADMQRLGLRYVSLTRSPVDSLEEEIRIKKPHVLLGNVESLSVQDIQRQICKMQISYIAVDEAQVKPFLAKLLFSYSNRWQIL